MKKIVLGFILSLVFSLTSFASPTSKEEEQILSYVHQLKDSKVHVENPVDPNFNSEDLSRQMLWACFDESHIRAQQETSLKSSLDSEGNGQVEVLCKGRIVSFEYDSATGFSGHYSLELKENKIVEANHVFATLTSPLEFSVKQDFRLTPAEPHQPFAPYAIPRGTLALVATFPFLKWYEKETYPGEACKMRHAVDGAILGAAVMALSYYRTRNLGKSFWIGFGTSALVGVIYKTWINHDAYAPENRKDAIANATGALVGPGAVYLSLRF